MKFIGTLIVLILSNILLASDRDDMVIDLTDNGNTNQSEIQIERNKGLITDGFFDDNVKYGSFLNKFYQDDYRNDKDGALLESLFDKHCNDHYGDMGHRASVLQETYEYFKNKNEKTEQKYKDFIEGLHTNYVLKEKKKEKEKILDQLFLKLEIYNEPDKPFYVKIAMNNCVSIQDESSNKVYIIAFDDSNRCYRTILGLGINNQILLGQKNTDRIAGLLEIYKYDSEQKKSEAKNELLNLIQNVKNDSLQNDDIIPTKEDLIRAKLRQINDASVELEEAKDDHEKEYRSNLLLKLNEELQKLLNTNNNNNQ